MGKKIKCAIIKKIGWLLLAFLCLTIPASRLNAWVDINGSGQGFNISHGDSAKRSMSGNVIEAYVEEAAGYYLQAQSDYNYFSSLYETAQDPIDYTLWSQAIAKARANFQKARESYYHLMVTAEATPYNMAVIEKLKAFDYKGFAATNRVNATIFGRVEYYLKAGNIRGLYKHVYDRVLAIENMVIKIEDAVNGGRLPEMNDVWTLTDDCSQKLMFGQYVANVFLSLGKINE